MEWEWGEMEDDVNAAWYMLGVYGLDRDSYARWLCGSYGVFLIGLVMGM